MAKQTSKSPAKGASAKSAPQKAAAPSPKKATPAKDAPAKAAKSAAPKGAKPVAKQTAPAKPAPAPAKKAPVKAAAQPAPKATPKAEAAPKTKAGAPKVAPVGAKTAPKAASAPAKPKADEAPAAPVKKPTVAAPTKAEVKPAIKPISAPAPAVAKKPTANKSSKQVPLPRTTTTSSVKYEPEFSKSVLDAHRQAAAAETGPTMRYSDGELVEFRELINRKLDTAKKELTYLQGLITRKDDSGDLDEGRYMTMEDGSMSMEREQLSQMASRQIQFIDHLEKALMRIENKTYGVCRVTGRLIDKARLRAVPHATLSMEAKLMKR